MLSLELLERAQAVGFRVVITAGSGLLSLERLNTADTRYKNNMNDLDAITATIIINTLYGALSND